MTGNVKSLMIFILICALIISEPVFAQPESKSQVIVKQDVLSPASLFSARIEGVVGQRIDSCIKNGVMSKNNDLYAVPFRDKLDSGGGFAGEFWGKWFTSAALAYGYEPNDSL